MSSFDPEHEQKRPIDVTEMRQFVDAIERLVPHLGLVELPDHVSLAPGEEMFATEELIVKQATFLMTHIEYDLSKAELVNHLEPENSLCSWSLIIKSPEVQMDQVRLFSEDVYGVNLQEGELEAIHFTASYTQRPEDKHPRLHEHQDILSPPEEKEGPFTRERFEAILPKLGALSVGHLQPRRPDS